ncbi:hypothetical protein QYE76_045628 [Lolium multiflorum]|uniref:Uncharacterized protein n=1 Tax=Lolium multiflorum TaxID=4521 RepID=A0AAD8WXV9_LOLMU|nr:hypothetical protein QYE76_045628 [Lolium multiflorum]
MLLNKNKNKKKRTCYNCDKDGHFANKCPYEKRVDKPKFIKGVKPRLKSNPINDRYKKNKGRAFVGAEYISDEEEEDEEKEAGVAGLAFSKPGSLFTYDYSKDYSTENDVGSSFMARTTQDDYSNDSPSSTIVGSCLMTRETKVMESPPSLSSVLDDEPENQEELAVLKELYKVRCTLRGEALVKFDFLMDSLKEKDESIEKLEYHLNDKERRFNHKVKDLETIERAQSLTQELNASKEDLEVAHASLTRDLDHLERANKLVKDELKKLGENHDLRQETHKKALGSMNDPVIDKNVASSSTSFTTVKQLKKRHPIKSIVTTSRTLELLHLDLFGPSHYDTLGGSKYGLFIVDDYSRYSWVFLLKSKDETHREFITFAKKAQRMYESEITAIRTDNGTEFKNYTMQEFVDDEGIKHEFSAPYTPQQNGVVERKNRTIIEMARTKLSEFNSPHNFWEEAISTAVHYSNRLFLRPLHTSFSQNSHTYRYYNKSTGTIEVSCDVVFLEDNGSQVEQVVPCVAGNDDDLSSAIKLMGIGNIRPIEVHNDDQDDGIEMSHIPKNKKKALNPLSKTMLMKKHPQLMFKLKLSLMIKKFEMSMMGELKFFLGFQVRQLAKGTFISQEKYVKDMLKKFNMSNASPMKTPMPVKGQLGSCDGEKDVDIKEKDMKSDYQNSGVTMESYTGDVKQRYYGKIEEIWELSYAGENVPMFRVRWAKNVIKEDRHFTTMPKFPFSSPSRPDPFIPLRLATGGLLSDATSPATRATPSSPRHPGDALLSSTDADALLCIVTDAPSILISDVAQILSSSPRSRSSTSATSSVTPFELRPIELLANPVLTCATATDAGYPSNFFANLFLYVQGSTELPIIAEISNMANNEEAGGSGSKPFWMLTDEIEVMESQPHRDDGEDDGPDPEYRLAHLTCPVNRLLNRLVRRVARSTGWETGPLGLSFGWTGPYAGSPSSSHNSVKTLEYMLCSLASLFPNDMYTYATAILALFADSQVIRVVMTVALLPREEGLRGLQDAVLAVACLLEHLRLLVQAAQLGEEATMGFAGGRAHGFKIYSQNKVTHGDISFCYPPEPTAGPPTISGIYYSYLVLAKLFCETLISKSGDSSEYRAYHLNFMYYCHPENQKTIDGCDLLYCELRRSVRERMTPNYAQYIQLLINKVVPAPYNKKDQRVKMEPFKMPSQGDRPEIPVMMPSERRSKEKHDLASSSYSRHPKRGASQFLTSLWQMCKIPMMLHIKALP